MSGLDALDVVSLLLGVALAVLAASTLGRRWRLPEAPIASGAMLVAGASLLLASMLSEILHEVQHLRR